MRHYELVVVLSPMLNQDQITETWDKIKGFITTREAEISHEEQWGTRRLAYPIRKGQHRFLEGSYHLTRFATQRAFNRDLENFLKVDEEILRSLVTVTLPEEELAAQAAAAARAIRTPPPRPAPLGPDGTPIPAEPPADGTDSPAAATVDEAVVSEAAQEAPVAEATAETSVGETAPDPVAEIESEPASSEGGASPVEEPSEPASESDDSEA